MMKKPLILFYLLFATLLSAGQAGMWTWIKGDGSTNGVGVFGIVGVPSPWNKPPHLYEAAEWTDLNGNFWLFGGGGAGGYNNALWKFNLLTNEWTWMHGSQTPNSPGNFGIKGIPSPLNDPSSRNFGSFTWVDLQGNLWFFGGSSISGKMNDLWKYDPSSNMWTWMKGDTTADAPGIYGTQGIAASTNKPGARDAAFTWTDASGNLWLFGGYGWATNGEAELNDLWKYDPSTNMWTWIKGDSILINSGIYGTQGIASALNRRPPRAGGVTWTDGLGNLWLFGGETDQTFQIVTYNDLWKYDPVTNMWTWMKGDNTVYGAGIYGTQGVGAPSNKPGARSQAFSWKGTTGIAGTLWLFGGRSINGNNGYNLNDLWKYDISTNVWTWMKGDNTVDVAGIYGSQGTPGILNKPGARRAGVTWTDALGSLCLFGGYGFAAMSSGGG